MNLSQNREKYKRSNFLQNDVVEGKDLSSMNFFRLFPNKYPHTICVVDEESVGRPDLISKKYLGVIEYWWIILKFNSIIDPFNELTRDLILKIPDLRDIQQFYSNYVNKG